MTISALSALLEAATGPDRQIDADIFRAIGLTAKQECHCVEWCRMDRRTDLTREKYIAAWAPEFTRTLNDALTLVPKDWRLIDLHQTSEGLWHAGVCRPGIEVGTDEACALPAIAISIAALRAREDDLNGITEGES